MSITETLDFWIKDVERTNFERLCRKPSENRWSLGQVCMHLIDSTGYFIEQSHICTVTDENSQLEMTSEAKIMFTENEFPDKLLEGPSSNAETRQPVSREEILISFNELKGKIAKLEKLTGGTEFLGKTRHPGLQYFNAVEWLQFADMHLRHHIRQRNRLMQFLKTD